MASVSGNGSNSSGRRRSLDAEINLVPFIDLLSMCICFLLMTAVWTQLGSVQVKQANGTEAAKTSPTKTVDIDLKFINSKEASLQIKKGGRVTRQVKIASPVQKQMAAQLEAQLKQVRAEATREGSQMGAVFLTPHQSVDYGALVSYMDVFRKQEMINIGVIPVKGAL